MKNIYLTLNSSTKAEAAQQSIHHRIKLNRVDEKVQAIA